MVLTVPAVTKIICKTHGPGNSSIYIAATTTPTGMLFVVEFIDHHSRVPLTGRTTLRLEALLQLKLICVEREALSQPSNQAEELVVVVRLLVQQCRQLLCSANIMLNHSISSVCTVNSTCVASEVKRTRTNVPRISICTLLDKKARSFSEAIVSCALVAVTSSVHAVSAAVFGSSRGLRLGCLAVESSSVFPGAEFYKKLRHLHGLQPQHHQLRLNCKSKS